MTNRVETINFANDLGYGSIKGNINNRYISVPSVMAKLEKQDYVQPHHFDNKTDKANYIKNLLNHLDVSIDSPAVNQSGRFLVGQSAVNAHMPLQSFDVSDFSGKATTNLSIILTLSTIAGTAVQQYYKSYRALPKKMLAVRVNMATALPIVENKNSIPKVDARTNKVVIDSQTGKPKKVNVSNYYKSRYTDVEHNVILHNFERPVTVHIHFYKNKTLVMSEGQAAHYAVAYATKTLKDMLRDDFAEHYPKRTQYFSSASQLESILTHASNTLGIDIGEGTTDFDVFQTEKDGSHINFSASNSIQAGYGNVLDDALQELHNNGNNVNSRSGLKEIMDNVDPLNPGRRLTAITHVKNQIPKLRNRIIGEASQILRRIASNLDIIYVYGGGSIPMEKYLRQPLMKKTEAFEEQGIPVVFINHKYAQRMNEIGLFYVLNAMIG